MCYKPGMLHPSRKHPAHLPAVHRHNTPVVILVTVCTYPRACILDNPAAHDGIVRAWRAADAWHAGDYVVMPDHVHVFCTPGTHEPLGVKAWAEYWKRLAGEFLPALQGVFQWECWDTQMRSRGHYCRKLEYVRQNPVRAGLVTAPDAWPYRGRVHGIWWP
jgi:putative transposase